MKASAPLFEKLTLACIVLLSLCVSGYAQSCGLLLTYDSHQYLSAAASFRASFQFTGPDGQPYSYWSPLFPMLLSLFDQPLIVLPWINVVANLLLAAMLYPLANHFLPQIAHRLVLYVFVLVGVHLQLISVFVWSELLFTALLLLFVFLLLHHERGYFFNLALLIGFLLCLQRNAGLFLMLGGGGWLFFTAKTARLRQAIILVAVTTSGLCIWNLFNAIRMGSAYSIDDHDYFTHLSHNLSFLLHAMVRALLPSNSVYVSFAVLVGFASALLRWRSWKTTSTSLLAWVLAAYLVGMPCLFELDPQDGDRYIAPLLPLVGLLLLSLVAAIQWPHTTLKWVPALILCLGLVYPLARTYKNTVLWHEMSCRASNPK